MISERQFKVLLRCLRFSDVIKYRMNECCQIFEESCGKHEKYGSLFIIEVNNFGTCLETLKKFQMKILTCIQLYSRCCIESGAENFSKICDLHLYLENLINKLAVLRQFNCLRINQLTRQSFYLFQIQYFYNIFNDGRSMQRSDYSIA